MRKLRLALIVVIILGAAFPAAAQPSDTRKNGSVIQTDYDDTYGHWQQCADIAGMCGLTTG
jgi:hypothetical protein